MDEYEALAFLGSMMVFILIVLLVLYLIGAVALYKYLRIRSYKNAWMAFIPIANMYAKVEATYGPGNYINLYGWRAPAALIKLWGVASYVLTVLVSFIPFIGNILTTALAILGIAVNVQIFMDIMDKLDDPQSQTFAIVANVFPIVASIKLLMSTGNVAPFSQNWEADPRVPASQTQLNGPLSFLNGSNNNQGQQ